MNQRLAKISGVAALSIAIMGMFIPQAAARQDTTHLAQGVDCHWLTCTNKTNDDYRVDFDLLCVKHDGNQLMKSDLSTTVVLAHRDESLESDCKTGYDPVDVHYKSASIVKPAPPGTGSAG